MGAAISDTKTAQLVRELKGGSQEAFAELYDMYSAALYGVVLKIVRSGDASEDVVQDAFVKVWKNIHKYDETKATFFTWALNIARNTAIDKWRKIKKEGLVEIQDLDSSVNLIDQTSKVTQKTNTIGLNDMVERLTPELKVVVEYLYFKGYTHQEASDELGLPLGTVKTRIRTALKELRKAFFILIFWILKNT